MKKAKFNPTQFMESQNMLEKCLLNKFFINQK